MFFRQFRLARYYAIDVAACCHTPGYITAAMIWHTLAAADAFAATSRHNADFRLPPGAMNATTSTYAAASFFAASCRVAESSRRSAFHVTPACFHAAARFHESHAAVINACRRRRRCTPCCCIDAASARQAAAFTPPVYCFHQPPRPGHSRWTPLPAMP
jgi:hypothetical protein